MRRPYCTSNWFYGLIAVYYQSRLMNVKRTHISLPFSPLGFATLSATVTEGGLCWAWQPDGDSCTAVAMPSRHTILVNPRGVGCFCHPLLTLGH